MTFIERPRGAILKGLKRGVVLYVSKISERLSTTIKSIPIKRRK